MRYRELVEKAPPFTKNFLTQVRKRAQAICADCGIPAGEKLVYALTVLMNEINQNALHAGKYLIERAELRLRQEIPDGISSVGCHWSWLSGTARVYHHDNAYDMHGRDNPELVEVKFDAEVNASDIDWVFTLATNLVLRGEYEITVHPGAQILIEYAWVDGKEIPVNQTVHVDGYYDED